MTSEVDTRGPDEENEHARFRLEALESRRRSIRFGRVTFLSGRDPRQLSLWRRRFLRNSANVPFFPQVGYADCGPACLRMTLASRGVSVSLHTLREETESGRNGTAASAILRVARRYGIDGRGVKCNLAGLRHLGPGAILFWKFNHFVVLDSTTQSHLVIVDPAVGRRRIGWDEAGENFTGIALDFVPNPTARHRGEKYRQTFDELRVAAGFLPQTGKWLSMLAASALLLTFNLAFPLVLGRLVERRDGTLFGGAGQLPIFLCAIFVYGLLQFARSRLIVTAQTLLEQKAGHALMSRLMRLPMSYFLIRHPGDIAHRVRSTARLKQVVSVTTVGAVFDATLVIGYVVVIAGRQLLLSTVVFASVLLLVLRVVSSWRHERRLSADVLDAHVQSVSKISEIINNIATVKSLGAEGSAHTQWANAFSAELSAGTRKRRHSGGIAAFVSTLQFATPLTVLVVGVLVATQQRSDLASAVALGAISASLFTSLTNLAQAAATLVELIPELTRINDILTAPVERHSPVGAGWLDRPPSVRLATVSFTYPGARSAAISEIDLDIGPGRFLAVIGPSGSGKSTIGMLLAGLLEPGSGKIFIGDRDLADLDPADFRSRIGYVDQNSGLMSGSILENIRLGNEEASIDQVCEAATAAGIDGFISGLAMKYETILGAGGTGISGGQRQRIALARVLVKRPQILILDEATSAVDPATEREIFDRIQGLGVTLVVLGHRAAMAADADAILNIERGRGTFTRRSSRDAAS